MNITLETPLRELSNPISIQKFWEKILINSYDSRHSSFRTEDNLPTWEKMISSNFRMFEFLKNLSDYYRKEKFSSKENKKEEALFFSIQMLDILKKENFNITNIFLENQKQNNGDWRYSEFIEIYLSYLHIKKEFIPNSLKEQLILETKEDKNYSSFRSVDQNIELYLNFLKVINPNDITYEWFSKNLELACEMYDEESRDIINFSSYLNFDSQKNIHEYINNFFPDKIDENKNYFYKILPSPIFVTQRFFQGSIDINLYQILSQNNLNQDNITHLTNIAKECLNIITKPTFMNLINENINVSNIETKDKQSNLILNFSTNNVKDLELFETIALRALNGVLQVSDKIKLKWTDSYYGDNELITNMDEKFIYQQYLHQTLNETLDINKQKTRKNKI